mmetsp:Transcript_47667/g.132265  ORF Transcript_47667/g.132265 Transcript_47667/m.132265 type:complete len:275 (-) Transcript_47667:101-925(-)
MKLGRGHMPNRRGHRPLAARLLAVHDLLADLRLLLLVRDLAGRGTALLALLGGEALAARALRREVVAAGEAEDGDGARHLVVARERTAHVDAAQLLGHLDAGGRHEALELGLAAHAERAVVDADLTEERLDLEAARVALRVAAEARRELRVEAADDAAEGAARREVRGVNALGHSGARGVELLDLGVRRKLHGCAVDDRVAGGGHHGRLRDTDHELSRVVGALRDGDEERATIGHLGLDLHARLGLVRHLDSDRRHGNAGGGKAGCEARRKIGI